MLCNIFLCHIFHVIWAARLHLPCLHLATRSTYHASSRSQNIFLISSYHCTLDPSKGGVAFVCIESYTWGIKGGERKIAQFTFSIAIILPSYRFQLHLLRHVSMYPIRFCSVRLILDRAGLMCCHNYLMHLTEEHFYFLFHRKTSVSSVCKQASARHALFS